MYYAYRMDSRHTDRLLHKIRTAPSDPGNPRDPQAVLHAIYEAIVEGDFDRLTNLTTEDVELHISGSNFFDGSWCGRDDVIAATKRNFSLLADQKPQIDDIACQGDCVAVLMRENGIIRESGHAYSLRAVQWCTFENGKLKRLDEIVALEQSQ